MVQNGTPPLSRAAQSVATVCTLLVLSVSILVLVGWAAGVPRLQRGFLGPVDVRPNAALALGFAAAALLVRRGAARHILAAVPFVIGAVTVAEWVFGIGLGIDSLFFDGPAASVRMSLRASSAIMFAGLALLFSGRQVPAISCGLVTGFIGALSSVAHFYGAHFLPHGHLAPIALSTAFLLMLWTLAFVIANSRSAPVSAFLAPDRWGGTARELSVVALAVPLIFGAFCLALLEAEAFDAAFAIAIITTATSFTFVLTIGRYTARLRAAELQSHEADAMYRTIVETSQEGICVIDEEQRFAFVNRRLASMIGREPRELIGQRTDSVVIPEERAAVAQRAEARRAGQEVTRTEVRMQHRDGSVVYAISSTTLLGPKSGHALATVADITDRVKAEKELRASEARFRGLYDSNLVGVAFWTLSRNVVDANEALLRIFGITRDQLPGWEWRSMNPLDGNDLDDRVIGELLEHGRCGPFEKELVRADGSPLSLLMAIAAIDAETNIAFVIDITERAQAQQQLERTHAILAARVQQLEGDEQAGDRELETLAAQLAEATAELETFSYSVSHDLRAPLRAIDGFSRELQTAYGKALDETGNRYLHRVRAATQRMSLLIDDLLDLSRLSRKPMRRRKVDVTALANEVAQDKSERITHDVAFAIAPGLAANADPHLLRIVLENLIGNAVKFSSRRSDAHVEVFANSGELVVRDNGAGFDGRYAETIFAPFQRLHPNEFEGTGIGLALVQRIIRRHGGSIRAEAEPGRGAAFFFTLGDPSS